MAHVLEHEEIAFEPISFGKEALAALRGKNAPPRVALCFDCCTWAERKARVVVRTDATELVSLLALGIPCTQYSGEIGLRF